ncbi:MAG: hypothetical protein WC584_02520 [Candidatus Pacearchaeota archaeon]
MKKIRDFLSHSNQENLKMKTIYTKVFAGIITAVILILLILSGPINALNLGLNANKEILKRGETITFTASLDINSNERLNVEYLNLAIRGPTSESCKFGVNGNFLSGCAGVNKIKLISNTATYGYGYGYGYGYTNGKLTYEITIDTLNYQDGKYTSELQAQIGGKMFSENGPGFTITYSGTGNGHSNYNNEEQKIILQTDLLNVVENGEYEFMYGVNSHNLKIDKIENETIYMTIYSDPQNLIIKLSDTQELDLDGDGINDTKINLVFIDSAEENAAILLKSDKEKISFGEKKEPVKKEKISSFIINRATNDGKIKAQLVSESNNNNNNIFWIVSILVLLDMILLEIILIQKKTNL